MNNSKFKAYLAIITATFIFGLTFMFSKIVLNYLKPIELIAIRFLVAFIMFEALRLTKVIKVNYKNKNIKVLIYTAIFQPVLYFAFETLGLDLVQSYEAGLMIALIPIFVTILSIFFLKEIPGLLQIIFIIVSVSGVIYINLGTMNSNGEINYLGLLYLLIAVISAALFNIFSRKASKEFSSVEITYFMSFLGMMVFNIIALISSKNISFYGTLFNAKVFFPMIYLSLMGSIIAFFLTNYSLSKLQAHVSSIFANVATIVSIFAGIIILKEDFYIYHLVGSMMIIVGIYGTAKFKKGT